NLAFTQHKLIADAEAREEAAAP
ncbi:hypothetical protein LCGC14_2164780, partial [marine sediment metagenome]